MPSILIGADICPIEGNRECFERGDAEALFHDLLVELQQADLVIANLECPLIEQKTPLFKTGPVFGESPDCLKAIKQAGIGVLCLANNHILDHGPTGLRSTLAACARNGIGTVGAGENLEAARRLLVREVDGVRVGILAVAETEFSIATATSPGANPIDMMEFVRSVTRHRGEIDYLIVLVHGSDEFLVPTPRIQNTCRFMVEIGANAVIVQHPHVLGGYEDYCGGHIIYGQGALIMDEAIYRNRPSFHEGFLVKLSITSERASTMEIVPFVQSSPAPGARRMNGAAERELRSRLEELSKRVQDPAAVQEAWLKFCEENKNAYLSGLLGHNRFFSKLNAGGLVTRFLYNKRVLLGVRNIVCCETHREAVETIFNHRLLQ